MTKLFNTAYFRNRSSLQNRRHSRAAVPQFNKMQRQEKKKPGLLKATAATMRKAVFAIIEPFSLTGSATGRWHLQDRNCGVAKNNFHLTHSSSASAALQKGAETRGQEVYETTELKASNMTRSTFTILSSDVT